MKLTHHCCHEQADTDWKYRADTALESSSEAIGFLDGVDVGVSEKMQDGSKMFVLSNPKCAIALQ